MAEKKKTKKAVAKKAAPKKATENRAVTKKAVAKKAATSTPKNRAVHKVAVKKAAAKKVAKKKTTTKKAVVKKSAVKKASAKKATSKKTASSRVTKKTAARPAGKRISSAAILNGPIRTQRVPEVPISREVKSPVATLTSPSPKSEVSNVRTTPALTSNATTRSISKQSRKDRLMLIAAAIIIVIAGVIAFAVPSSNQDSAADGSSIPDVVASESASPEATLSEEPSSSSASSNGKGESAKSFALRFSYNSIGITLNFASAQQYGAVNEYVIKYSENGGASKILGTFDGQTPSARISKIDTVGKTVFSVEAVLADGTKIASSPLAIRGLFAAE